MKLLCVRRGVAVKMLLVVVTLLFSSCFSLYSPVSDVHLLRNKRTSKPRTTGLSIGTSVMGAGVSRDLVNTYKRDDTGEELALRNRLGVSIASAFGNDVFSFGFAVGATVGVDATWAAGSNTFLSGSANLKRNFEAVVHTIIPLDEVSAVGVGVFFRSDRHGLVGNDCKESTHWFCSNENIDRYFRVHAIGLRLSMYDNTSPFRLYAGYSPELKKPVLIANLTFVRADR